MHAHRDLAVELLGDREQLDDVAEIARGGDVVEREPGDALAVDVGRGDASAERDRSDDGALRRGVEALDVGGGIALGEAELLRIGKRVVEPRPAVAHAT